MNRRVTEPQPEPLQQDTPPAFGGSIWSDGRKLMVTGNSLDDVLQQLRASWLKRDE